VIQGGELVAEIEMAALIGFPQQVWRISRPCAARGNVHEPADSSSYEDQIHVAERELASFIMAVKECFGPEQARLSVDDWLDECELMDSPPRCFNRNWGAVTVAASAKLANRVTAFAGNRASA
jgi:hypothetical protein